MKARKLIAGCAGMLLASAAWVAGGQDAERLTHGDEASTPQASYERREGDVTLRQYQLGCLSQLSYLITSRGEAAVVDPLRDVEHYLRDAQAQGARIRYVVLTHTHADFVAGHTELAARAGAEVLISADSGSQFVHRPLQDGERATLGAAELEFLAVPGHTLDSMSVLVRVSGSDPNPTWILTGDALFIGSIGRPDLAQGTISPMALASKAFDSLRRLRALPDETILLPAHGAGSLCGAHLSAETTSTLGREKATNPYFNLASRAAFIARDVADLPPAPPYFAHDVALNRAGPPAVDWSEEMPPAMGPRQVLQALAAGAWAIDLRDARAYAQAHVQGSINVAVRGRLDTWTGSVVPFEAPLLLIGSASEVREAAFRFKRIGLDRVRGYLAADLETAHAAGLLIRTTELVAPEALYERMQRGTEPVLVDVRTAEEHAELAIGSYVQLALTDWKRFAELLDPSAPVVFVCNSAYRSSMAVGLAELLGFRDIATLDGGIDAWLAADLPVYGTSPACAGPVCPTPGFEGTPATRAPTLPAGGGMLELAEPIEPAALATLLADQPQTYVIVDVRPAWQFDEYHVPGAVNVALEGVAGYLQQLPASARVVLVDRDGTLAWALAGALGAELGPRARPLRVLAGGTARFWREVEVGGQSLPSLQPTASPSAAPGAPPAPKKRSAGC
jgi:glyoxylase-like metal-dependent hydrolase (beta-lactamase superfamily II)/rhodanese-related sulfurtransferase